MGYIDDLNNSPDRIDLNKYLAYQQQLRDRPTTKTAPKKQKGRGGFLSSIISELGGAGGAAGGAAIGTALLPGVGTLLGAGIGGFLGGTGGRVAENKVRDNRIGLGDALKEGALSGAFSVAGEGYQLAKGAKAAKGISKVLGNESDEIANATRNAPKLGALQNKGLGMTSKAGGYFVGAEVPGAKALTPAKVKYYDDLLKKLNIGANDSSDLARGIEQRLSAVGSGLEKNIAKNNIAVDTKVVAKDLMNKIAKTPGLTPEAEKFGRRQAGLLANLDEKDASGLLKFRRQMDSFINQNANPDAATSGQQAVARIFRGGVKDKLNSLLPGFKNENNLFHDLSDIQSYALRASKRTGMESTSGGGGLFGRVASSPTANTVKAKAGRAIGNVGAITAGAGGFPSQVVRQAKIQAVPNLADALGGAQPQRLPETDMMSSEAPPDFSIPEPQMEQQSPYSLQQALADIQRDPRNQAQYLSLYKSVEAATKPDKVAIKAQDAQAAGSQALNIVDQLEQSFSQAGGGQGRIGGIASSLMGKAGLNDSVNVYNDNKMAFLSNVARSLGEKGVLTDADIARVAKAFPSPSANPAEAAAKWSMIRSIISGGIQKAQSAYGAPAVSDLSSVLGAYQ